jgi:CheY-like chemotaxis protein
MSNRGRILIAEDNRVNQRLVEAMVQQLGFQSDTHATGKAAVEACLAGSYLAVLMDGFMPEMDGFDAAREIRRRERGRRTPIIALTASDRARDRGLCFDAGMDDFLVKPVKLAALATTMERWISPE